MNPRARVLFLFATLALVTPSTKAGETGPAPATPPVTPAVQPVDSLDFEFKSAIEAIAAKIKNGERSAAALAPEIATLDALTAKYASTHPEDASQLLLLKARLQIEVFADHPQGLVTLRELQAKFPQTSLGQKAGAIIQALEKQAANEQTLGVGKPFPTFAVQDLHGQPLDLAAYKGKIVLIDFWATWCGPCVRELPNVIAAYEKHHARGFEIIGISLDKDRDTLVHFLEEKKMTWPQYFDGLGWENKLAAQFEIGSIPATFLLNGEGQIIARDLRGEDLEQELTELLK